MSWNKKTPLQEVRGIVNDMQPETHGSMKTKVMSSSTVSGTPQSNPVAMSRAVSGEERGTVRPTGVGGTPKQVMTTSTNSKTHEGGTPTGRTQGTRCIHSPNLCDKEDYLCIVGSCVFDAEANIC